MSISKKPCCALYSKLSAINQTFLALIDNCTMQCRYLDAQELSWPIQSRTLSVMTFCKERWQSNQQSSIRPEEFLTLR